MGVCSSSAAMPPSQTSVGRLSTTQKGTSSLVFGPRSSLPQRPAPWLTHWSTVLTHSGACDGQRFS